MGFLDKLAKKGLGGLKDKLEKATGVDLDGAFQKLTDAGRQDPAPAPAYDRAPSARPAAPAAPRGRAYFAGILEDAFAAYEVQSAVSAADLGIAAGFPVKSYDFVLSQGGVCRGVIMLTPHNRDNNAAFKNARAAAQDAGIPFINFYLHYPNERAYVIDRIRRFLG